MKTDTEYIEVAVALPVFQTFTYCTPETLAGFVAIGKRVLIPFGQRRVTGYVLGSDRDVGRPFGRLVRAVFRPATAPAAHNRLGITVVREKKISLASGRELWTQPFSPRKGSLTVRCLFVKDQYVS